VLNRIRFSREVAAEVRQKMHWLENKKAPGA
jgi:hypothetical protein